MGSSYTFVSRLICFFFFFLEMNPCCTRPPVFSSGVDLFMYECRYSNYCVVCCLLAVDLSYTGMQYEDEEDDFRVDFDYLGYLRNPEEYRRIRSTGVLNMDDEDVCYLP